MRSAWRQQRMRRVEESVFGGGGCWHLKGTQKVEAVELAAVGIVGLG